jgi:hypothetical protein
MFGVHLGLLYPILRLHRPKRIATACTRCVPRINNCAGYDSSPAFLVVLDQKD